MHNVTPVHAFNDNYIWLIDIPDIGSPGKTSGRVAIVDPGDAEPVLKKLEELSLTPIAILITHHHYDHTGGIQQILAQYSVPVYGPANKEIAAIDHPLVENDEFTIAKSMTFNIIEIPGHTLDHIAFYTPGMLFCGDTLFTGGCGRLFEGTAQQMVNSLEKLVSLPDDTAVYCGHEYTLSNLKFAIQVEPDNAALQARLEQTKELRAADKATVPSTIGLEKSTNPFLRSHSPAIADNAAKYAKKPLNNDTDVFAIVRHWKDDF